MDRSISIRDDNHAWAEAHASDSDLPNAAAYIDALIDKAREREDGIAKLRLLIAEADASGDCGMSVDEVFEHLARRRQGG